MFSNFKHIAGISESNRNVLVVYSLLISPIQSMWKKACKNYSKLAFQSSIVRMN